MTVFALNVLIVIPSNNKKDLKSRPLGNIIIIYLSIFFFKIWFQNRRAKFKRESKDAQMNWMRKQFYTENHDVTVTSEKNSHLISCSPPEMHGESRLQPDRLPSKK